MWILTSSLTAMLCLGSKPSLTAGDEKSDPASVEKAVVEKTVIDKAIEAAGGENRLNRYAAMSSIGKGTLTTDHFTMKFRSERHIQLPDRARAEIDGEVDRERVRYIRVVNADKGWMHRNDRTTDVTTEEMANLREEMHAENVMRLLCLKGKEYGLSMAGETRIDDRPAVGVKVKCKNRRDITLYFDKETHLVVRRVMQVMDRDSAKLIPQEVTYSGHKEFEGIKFPTKISVRNDGKPYAEIELIAIKPLEKLDDKIFDKP